jgi:hypothetical protein
MRRIFLFFIFSSITACTLYQSDGRKSLESTFNESLGATVDEQYYQTHCIETLKSVDQIYPELQEITELKKPDSRWWYSPEGDPSLLLLDLEGEIKCQFSNAQGESLETFTSLAEMAVITYLKQRAHSL